MAKACREVGRDPKTLYTTAFALGCVLKQGESSASPRARRRPVRWRWSRCME